MEYKILTLEDKIAILRNRIRTEETQHYETKIGIKLVGDDSQWALTNLPNLEHLEGRIQILKEELATLEEERDSQASPAVVG